MIRQNKKFIQICTVGLLVYTSMKLLMMNDQECSSCPAIMTNDNASISGSIYDGIRTENHSIQEVVMHKDNLSNIVHVSSQNLTHEEKKEPPNFKSIQSRIITPHKFAYLINHPNRCTEDNISIIFYIHTAPNNVNRRNRIRHTWGQIHSHNGYNISYVFLLGNSMNVTIENMLRQEDSKYGDLIQEDFIDSYRNMSIKNIMGLKWIHTFCRTALFIVKIDDDVMVDPFHLTRYLRSRFHDKTPKKFMYCSTYTFLEPHRTKYDAWYVPPEEYPEDKYPRYCEGFAYIISPDVAAQLLHVSQYLPLFWIDDIHVTGILRRQTDIKLEQWRRPNDFALLHKEVISKQVQYAIFFLVKWDDMFVNWDGTWNKILEYKI